MRVVTPGLTWRRVRAVSLDASGSLLIVCIRQVPSRKERESEVGGYDLRACLPEAGDLEPADCLQQVYAPEPEGTPPSDRYVHGKGVGYGGIIIRVARSHSMRHRTDRCHRSGFSPLGTFDMNYCFMRSSRPPPSRVPAARLGDACPCPTHRIRTEQRFRNRQLSSGRHRSQRGYMRCSGDGLPLHCSTERWADADHHEHQRQHTLSDPE